MQVKQARELMQEVILLGSDAWDEGIFNNQSEFEGAFWGASWNNGMANTWAQDFVTVYRSAYEKTPISLAALTYDALAGSFMQFKARRG